MRKIFRQILQERSDLDLSSSTFDELIEIMQQIRKSTIKECLKEGYCLYYEHKLDANPSYLNIDKESLEKLNKNSIEIL